MKEEAGSKPAARMSFMDVVTEAREQNAAAKSVRDGEQEIETFLVARSELFGTRAIFDKEAKLVQQENMKEEEFYRKRRAA